MAVPTRSLNLNRYSYCQHRWEGWALRSGPKTAAQLLRVYIRKGLPPTPVFGCACTRLSELLFQSGPLPNQISARAALCQSGPLRKRVSAKAVLCQSGPLPQRSSATAVLFRNHAAAKPGRVLPRSHAAPKPGQGFFQELLGLRRRAQLLLRNHAAQSQARASCRNY